MEHPMLPGELVDDEPVFDQSYVPYLTTLL
jgi:hypothetical protein